MKKNSLSQTNPHLRNTQKMWQLKVRSLASSTAIETGEPIEVIEEKINYLRSVESSVTLA